MGNKAGRQWENEIITNRVTVSKNADNVRVKIKAPSFAMGNNFLTLCIAIGVLAECVITFLMIKSTINLAMLIPAFMVLGVGLSLSFTKLWLWHNFGEELINIKGNSFEMHRSFGMYKKTISQLTLDDEAELYSNRNDTWSWIEFRGKGIFRLATIDAKLADFGLKLNDEEYEMILRPIADQLKSLKAEAGEIQFANAEQKTEVIEVEEVKEETSGIVDEPVEEEIIQPPNLEQQTEGQHANALNDYLEKAKDGKSVKKSDTSQADKKQKTQ